MVRNNNDNIIISVAIFFFLNLYKRLDDLVFRKKIVTL